MSLRPRGRRGRGGQGGEGLPSTTTAAHRVSWSRLRCRIVWSPTPSGAPHRRRRLSRRRVLAGRRRASCSRGLEAAHCRSIRRRRRRGALIQWPVAHVRYSRRTPMRLGRQSPLTEAEWSRRPFWDSSALDAQRYLPHPGFRPGAGAGASTTAVHGGQMLLRGDSARRGGASGRRTQTSSIRSAGCSPRAAGRDAIRRFEPHRWRPLRHDDRQCRPKHLYDEESSCCSSDTRLPEYYPTRTELGLLESAAADRLLHSPGRLWWSSERRPTQDAADPRPAPQTPSIALRHHEERVRCRSLITPPSKLIVSPLAGDFTSPRLPEQARAGRARLLSRSTI